MASNDQDFAHRLRELRKQKSLSQTELRAMVDIHYTHIGRYERGTSRPNSDTLKRLADILGVTGDYLMEGTTNDVARARMEDRELLQQFQEVEKLSDEDKHVVKVLIDAFLTKKKLRQLPVENASPCPSLGKFATIANGQPADTGCPSGPYASKPGLHRATTTVTQGKRPTIVVSTWRHPLSEARPTLTPPGRASMFWEGCPL